ncbi:hypothetical protein J437_LFUL011885 [Ladona fulva]|uniref:Uncharacterized protein n=1 Tax=Ladona fulva TaxID=123851 RepID=A0A8K0P120_LADFU|nr:hypothetical protein J437_LFUL011885 [Ladona fulva]
MTDDTNCHPEEANCRTVDMSMTSAMPREELILNNDNNSIPANPVNYDMSKFAELELLSLKKELILEEAKEKKREHEMRMEILAMQRQLLLQEAEDKRREHEVRMKMLMQNDVQVIKQEGT